MHRVFEWYRGFPGSGSVSDYFKCALCGGLDVEWFYACVVLVSDTKRLLVHDKNGEFEHLVHRCIEACGFDVGDGK